MSRSNFGLFYKDIKSYFDVDFNVISASDKFPNDTFRPCVIEGADLLDTLCPVSKFTGARESPFSLLGKITNANSDLLNAVLQELPVIASNPSLSDADRVEFLVSRLGSGTPAEDALLSSRLMSDIDALGLRNIKDDSVSDLDTKISFDPVDVSNSD